MATEAALRTLPGDDVRQIMWRFSDRYDLQMLIQSSRAVARGPVARVVAAGGRNSHEWTEEKNELLKVFDESGITAAFMDIDEGGYIPGPKNLPLALIAFELAWVDAGAATCSLANNLALGPIHERGTPEQKNLYMSRCIPPQPGEERKSWRGSFVLTEPLPYVGVDTSVLSGRVRVAEWADGAEPMIHVEKRGRFITGMGFSNFVTAAVESDDARIKGTCMVVLEENDPGLFDRGIPTKKMVHQLSSTRDPIFNMRVPANRIIGGYTIKDGVIIPNFSHGEIIEAVFRRTRVTVGIMTSAKLLSAVEPIIRYQRGRFRGGQNAVAGTPRFDLGIQMKEDALHRLVDIWATGEASASLGFETARLFDEFDSLEREKDKYFAGQGLKGRAQLRAFMKVQDAAKEYIKLSSAARAQAPDPAMMAKIEQLKSDILVQYVVKDSLAQVLCPACKLWNTGYGVTMMREAVSLMGGYGITEDCPGFIGNKWMDAQLEATYEGPEAVQRRQLSITMINELFLDQFRLWIDEMRTIAARRPGTGACTVASAMDLWLWTLNFLQTTTDANGKALYHSQRHGVAFPMADALCWLLASRSQILDVLELEEKGKQNSNLAEGLDGYVRFLSDLCHVQAVRAASEVGRVCAELVHGYSRHPEWDEESLKRCYSSDDLDALESVAPGISCCARAESDVVESDGAHPKKAGPCVKTSKSEFARKRAKLDGCMTGARLAKDRAAAAVSQVMIPEALDYPS